MAWFIRKNDKITGPFPEGQIQQSLILNRLTMHDEVSKDREEWQRIADHPELIPEVLLAAKSDPQSHERLQAARRWADERRTERRIEQGLGRIGPGRREPEGYGVTDHREHREEFVKEIRSRKQSIVMGIMFTTVLLVFGLIAGFIFETEELQGAQCDALAQPGVNWSHCSKASTQQLDKDLSGAILNSTVLHGASFFGSNLTQADLSYSSLVNANLSFTNLTQAKLVGADLNNADLSSANLYQANLTYANLKGAKLETADLTEADVSNAIWVDGSICQNGSIGRCVK